MSSIARVLILCLIFGAEFSLAAVQIDPSLQRLLNTSAESDRQVSVILVHKNLLPNPREMVLNRAGYQMHLMKNADFSQAQTLRHLERALRTDGARVQFRRYWLGNSVIVKAPVRVIRQILQTDAIAVARPLLQFRLIAPAIHPASPLTGEAFTYGLQKMRIPELRQKISTADGRGIRVGILDTGIDPTHPDLKGKTILFKDFVEEQKSPYDDHGHGTHVAGTIAGGSASGTSIGVAPAVQLIVGKIFDEEGSADEMVIMNGLQWMADPDGNPSTPDAPMLVSNSWGGGVPGGDPADSAECRAMDSWVKLSMLPIFAAGNHGPRASSVSLPAGCPSAVAVGATDENDVIAKFSSRGPVVWSTGTLMKPLISAPGVAVLSSTLGGRYGRMSGTSMATPHVAGVAALIYQARPNARVEDVAKMMMAGAVDLGAPGQDPAYGFGRVDVMRTLEIAFRIRE